MLQNRKIKSAMLLGLFALSMCILGLDLAAHAADQEDNAAGTGLYQLPAVTVTADKRLTDVQKTPIALTVITAQDLEDKNIRTLREVLTQVPNLNITAWAGGINFASFRGAISITGTGASPLIMYIDGVPVDTFYSLDANLMDIERIEILRGPQSAIYGKNALGGVINIISRKPGNTYESKIASYLESYGGWGAGATVSGPLKEDLLSFSLSASHDNKDGWMDSMYTGKSNESRTERVKGQLRFTPSEQSEFMLHTDYTATRDGFYAHTFGNSYSEKSWGVAGDRNDVDTVNAALTGKVDFEPFIFESISTFRFEDTEYKNDTGELMRRMGMDGAGISGNGENKKELTQEFRLRSPEGAEGLAWLLGAYGSYADKNLDYMFQEFHYFMFPGLGDNSRYDQAFRQYTTEFAPFAQAVLPVTDAFKVTAGLRWHYTNRKTSIKFLPDQALQSTGVFQPMATEAEDDWNELLPKLLLSYDLSDEHMLYAGVSRSFIPGGYNYATQQNFGYTYDSQKAWNYEVGAKTSWLDNRLNVNLALFYSRFDDLQIMQLDPGTNLYVAHNAGSSSSYGAELDIAARLAKGLDAQVGFGYTHAQYGDYKYGADVYDDKKIEFTPEYTLNASLTYRHDSGLFVMGSMRYMSKIYWTAANEDSRSDVTTVDAKIGYEGESFEVYLYGKNIFGERYLTYYTPITQLAIVAPPQTFGVQAAYRF